MYDYAASPAVFSEEKGFAMAAPSRAHAQAMHSKLQEWGVVDQVRHVLMQPQDVDSVSDVFCWVETERERGVLVVCVKVAFKQHSFPPRGAGRVAAPTLNKAATFRVEVGKPFGPIGAPPLTDATVAGIYRMAGVEQLKK